MKFAVTVIKTGMVFVEAENAEKAAEIAENKADEVVQTDDTWIANGVMEDDSAPQYVTGD